MLTTLQPVAPPTWRRRSATNIAALEAFLTHPGARFPRRAGDLSRAAARLAARRWRGDCCAAGDHRGRPADQQLRLHEAAVLPAPDAGGSRRLRGRGAGRLHAVVRGAIQRHAEPGPHLRGGCLRGFGRARAAR
ncbi:MAG: hypothetical protein WDO13_18825 [Verrucomicrobiota bacterium]